MSTRYDILPDSQRRILPALTALRHLGFVLYGGTAIALRLGHRVSIDFDFFTDRSIDRGALYEVAPLLADAIALQDEPHGWTVQTRPIETHKRPVKLSFFSGLRFGRVGQPTLTDNGDIMLASLDDLLGHKLKALLQRAEVKDYQDIAAMLESGLTLERGLGAAMALFPDFPSFEAIRALVYFGDGNVNALSSAHRATLLAHADRISTPVRLDIVSTRLDCD